MRVLFLYSELADYTIACLRALKSYSPEVEIRVIFYPVNKEAPFSFSFDNLGVFTCISDFPDFKALFREVVDFKPDKVVCSGWANSWYLLICGKLRKTAVTILCSDNIWKGTAKQRLLAVCSGFTLRRIFEKLWIPGSPQLELARKLGYDSAHTLQGFYSCDVDRFSKYYHRYLEKKKAAFPHRFLCVARYIPAKGYDMLWNAFIEWKRTCANDWELWCAGSGEEYNSRVIHPAIRHLGFVQKDEWDEIISQTGVFILPSHHEPWGVVVHEFACAGYPLLLSCYVGAQSAFLTGDNGFVFDPQDTSQLIACFDKIASKSDDQLMQMGSKSFSTGGFITPRHWTRTLLTSGT